MLEMYFSPLFSSNVYLKAHLILMLSMQKNLVAILSCQYLPLVSTNVPSKNRILLPLILGGNLLLFHIFAFILRKKRLWLPAFTSFYSIHVKKYTKKLLRLQSNPQKTQFTTNPTSR